MGFKDGKNLKTANRGEIGVRDPPFCEVARRSAYDPRLPQLAACLSARAAISSAAEQDRIVRSPTVTKFIVVFHLLNS